jgi:hypothetical protein
LTACTAADTGRENTHDYIADKLKPKSLVLSQSALILTANSAAPTVTASVSGHVENCYAKPALPAGLTLNPKTCAISGTPTATQLSTPHTIAAQNEYGTAEASIDILVNSTLAFARTNYAAAIVATITPITPTSAAAITACSISPDLPSGLSLGATTCSITGATPSVAGPTTYTVTATDGVQSASTSVTLEFGKVTYAWGTATDNANGRITYVMSSTPPSGFSAGTTFTLAKCSLGQTWQASTNSCTGSAVAYSRTNAATQCTAAGGTLPIKNYLQAAIHCTDKTYPSDEYANCGAGNYTSPSVSALFNGTESASYWTSQMDQDQVCGSWCMLENKGYYYVDYSTSGIWRDANTTTSLRYLRCRF